RLPGLGILGFRRQYPSLDSAGRGHRSRLGGDRRRDRPPPGGSIPMSKPTPWLRVLQLLALVAVAVGLAMALRATVDAFQGEYSRIMHVHVPTSWLAFLAFGITALGSIVWRIRRHRRWDRLASASAELGVLFTAMSLATGS